MITQELAEQEFNRFVEAMDLDLDPSDMDAEDLAGFLKTKKRLIKAVMAGSLVFNDDGEAVYTPVNPKSKYQDPITFHERTGTSIMAMDGKKKGHDVAKMYAVMADLTRLPAVTFSGLVGVDIKVCESILLLLMD